MPILTPIYSLSASFALMVLSPVVHVSIMCMALQSLSHRREVNCKQPALLQQLRAGLTWITWSSAFNEIPSLVFSCLGKSPKLSHANLVRQCPPGMSQASLTSPEEMQ